MIRRTLCYGSVAMALVLLVDLNVSAQTLAPTPAAASPIKKHRTVLRAKTPGPDPVNHLDDRLVRDRFKIESGRSIAPVAPTQHAAPSVQAPNPTSNPNLLANRAPRVASRPVVQVEFEPIHRPEVLVTRKDDLSKIANRRRLLQMMSERSDVPASQKVDRATSTRSTRVAGLPKSPWPDKDKLSKINLEPKLDGDDPPGFESPETEEPAPNVAEVNEVEEVLEYSPRAWLDPATTGRTPASARTAILPSATPTVRSPKAVQLESDHFFHRKLLFEEPLHERHGIRDKPVRQLGKSVAAFFAKSYVFPAQLLLKKNRGCDASDGWGDRQGDQICGPGSE